VFQVKARFSLVPWDHSLEFKSVCHDLSSGNRDFVHHPNLSLSLTVGGKVEKACVCNHFQLGE
jgi:hypothetical protein